MKPGKPSTIAAPAGMNTRPGSGDLVEQVIIRRSRLVDKDVSAQYLGTSTDTIERLINTGALPVVRLPVERAHDGKGQAGASRRVLIDVRDLDALIERSKETVR